MAWSALSARPTFGSVALKQALTTIASFSHRKVIAAPPAITNISNTLATVYRKCPIISRILP